jgi:hypothetical protein
MAYTDLDDVAAFIAETTRLGVATAILAWQDEYGQVPDAARVDYDRVRVITLLAYHQGTILRCRLAGGKDERAHLRGALQAAGLAVEERSRNIVGFDVNRAPFRG